MFLRLLETVTEEDIFLANKKISQITGSNKTTTEITSCGLIANSLLYLLPKYIIDNYKTFCIIKQDEYEIFRVASCDEIINMMQKNKKDIFILRFSINSRGDLYNDENVECGNFPGHAFIICKVDEAYYLFQSYINEYKLQVSKIENFKNFISMVQYITSHEKFDWWSSRYWKYITNVSSAWDNYYGKFKLDIHYCTFERKDTNGVCLPKEQKKISSVYTTIVKKYKEFQQFLKKYILKIISFIFRMIIK